MEVDAKNSDEACLNPYVSEFVLRYERNIQMPIPRDKFQPSSGSFAAIRIDHLSTRLGAMTLRSSSDPTDKRSRNNDE